jgi:cyclopropane-fatty-acyl-phospholipid synthase
MNYSSALFTCATRTLEEAQEAKLSRIVDLLDVEPGQSILEIGCGWGPLAERLIRQGCLITGLTLSAEQLDLARVRLRRQAAPRNWDIRLQDYRDVEGRYDRIVSVESHHDPGVAICELSAPA